MKAPNENSAAAAVNQTGLTQPKMEEQEGEETLLVCFAPLLLLLPLPRPLVMVVELVLLILHVYVLTQAQSERGGKAQSGLVHTATKP